MKKNRELLDKDKDKSFRLKECIVVRCEEHAGGRGEDLIGPHGFESLQCMIHENVETVSCFLEIMYSFHDLNRDIDVVELCHSEH